MRNLIRGKIQSVSAADGSHCSGDLEDAGLFVTFLETALFKEENENYMSVELEDRGRALENDYFRRQEQELIAKMKSKINAEGLSASDLNCPKCDGKLVETNFENIKIDVCSGCTGVWLDAGEFAQIANHETENKGWFSRHFG